MEYCAVPFAGKGKNLCPPPPGYLKQGWWLVDGKFVDRFNAPPPDGVEPDPDYVPEVGEWFWFQNGNRNWYRYCRHEDGSLTRENGQKTIVGWYTRDKGSCLPAEPPE